MADLVGAIMNALLADAAFNAASQGRVFAGELPPAETASMPRAATMIQPAGGASIAAGSFVEHDTQRLDLFFYGETPNQANELARAGRDVLSRLRRVVVSGVLIHWVEPAGGYSAGRDRDGNWPVAYQSYQVFSALKEVS
ncbi:DUF3168 domain-containing protein [Stappia albiluteola]|uniref:DUF3168 domain-containing protein n=1 Tax=Stappia albiluteola TaxID=2758565 RepID=UPI002E282B4D|nr:DUF3168 domain-containing protein [Stappia albiluteola]